LKNKGFRWQYGRGFVSRATANRSWGKMSTAA
jgi:hypothetical protein